MKSRIFLLGIAMSWFGIAAFAQNDFIREPDLSKPLLFSDMPPFLTVPLAELESLLFLSSGKSASLLLNGQFPYKGVVSSVTPQNDGKLLTIIIRSVNRHGSRLTLSRITTDDGSFYWSARILSFGHGDCYVLKRNADNSYVFEKKKFYEVVSE